MWKLNNKRIISLISGIIAIFLLSGASACDQNTQAVYTDNVNIREETFKRAQNLYPMPNPSDFPLRKDLVEFTLREAKPGPWYVYIQTDSGSYSSYYVAKNKPQNSCNFLSSTTTSSWWSSSIPVDAPSMDGIYYGGTGASGACDAWFWFDAITNALVETRFKTTVSDQPLAIDVPMITIKNIK